MTEVQIFNHPKFGGVRTLGDADNPKFCLSDVCRIMEIGNPSDVKNRLDKGVVSIETLQTNGRTQNANFVSEDGVVSIHPMPLIEREY